ncbi:MAG: hypothetical protein WAU02_03660 [Candidatus Saccharimonadales bacterium]
MSDELANQNPPLDTPPADADGYYGDEGGDNEVDVSFLDDTAEE